MKRLPLLDLLRGLALIGMVIYHAAYDLQYYWSWNIDVNHGTWKLFERCIAILFLLVSGIAIALSEERHRGREPAHKWKRRLKRFALTGSAAVIVSIATYLADPETFVRFGILHLVAVSRLLLPFFLLLGSWQIVLGGIIALLSLSQPWIGSSFLEPLGIYPHGFMTVDYFPLIPWFGVLLMGAGLLSLQPVRALLEKEPPQNAMTTAIEAGGRHTLLIYLLHQPLLLAVFWLLARV